MAVTLILTIVELSILCISRPETDVPASGRLFAEDLAKRNVAAMRAILLLMQQDRLEAEDAVLLTMYAHAKAHHDGAKSREERFGKFAATRAAEAMVAVLISSSGLSFLQSWLVAVGGMKFIEKKLAAGVQTVCEELGVNGVEKFPTFPAFKEHLHRHWSEWGDLDELQDGLGM